MFTLGVKVIRLRMLFVNVTFLKSLTHKRQLSFFNFIFHVIYVCLFDWPSYNHMILKLTMSKLSVRCSISVGLNEAAQPVIHFPPSLFWLMLFSLSHKFPTFHKVVLLIGKRGCRDKVHLLLLCFLKYSQHCPHQNKHDRRKEKIRILYIAT